MDLDVRSFTREADTETNEYAKMFEKSEEPLTSEDFRKHKSELVQHKVAEAIASIADTLNGGDKKDVVEGMLEGLRRTHRYIQSEFWMGMIELIKQTGELDSAQNFDGRNEWTQDMCKRMYTVSMNPDAINMEVKG